MSDKATECNEGLNLKYAIYASRRTLVLVAHETSFKKRIAIILNIYLLNKFVGGLTVKKSTIRFMMLKLEAEVPGLF